MNHIDNNTLEPIVFPSTGVMNTHLESALIIQWQITINITYGSTATGLQDRVWKTPDPSVEYIISWYIRMTK